MKFRIFKSMQFRGKKLAVLWELRQLTSFIYKNI